MFCPALKIWPLIAVLMCLPGTALAQAAAEYAGSVASATAASTSAAGLGGKSDRRLSQASLPQQEVSAATRGAHLPILSEARQPASEEENRRAIERRAGEAGAKLMLRSDPAGAFVQVDQKPVGKTPLLLVVPPGRYAVTFESDRYATDSENIDVLPKETREVLVRLEPRYPTHVTLAAHGALDPKP